MNYVLGFDCLDNVWSKKVSWKYGLTVTLRGPDELLAVLTFVGHRIQVQGLRSGSFSLHFRFCRGSYVNLVNSVLVAFHTY